jgi:hypothetical protein
MTAEAFASEIEWVTSDFEALRSLLESRPTDEVVFEDDGTRRADGLRAGQRHPIHGVIPANAGISVGGVRGLALIDEPGDARPSHHTLPPLSKRRFPLSRE